LWLGEGLVLAITSIWVLLWQPGFAKDALSDWPLVVYQTLVPIASAFAGLALVYLVGFAIAPYKAAC
jgi:hypothetical protein